MKTGTPFLILLVASACFLAPHGARAATLLTDNFDTPSTPPIAGRVSDGLLDGGWRSTSGYTATPSPSLWDITGGTLQNPASVDPDTGIPAQYTESESPAWQWWTNPVTTTTDNLVQVSFDYSVGAGDTLTAHLWAVETGGTPTTTNTWITNNQGWANGNSGQNQGTSAGGNTPYNLLDGTNPAFTGGITGAGLTGTGTFNWSIDVSTLGIASVSDVGDIDTFFIAFAADEKGGGTTSVDNLVVSSAVPEPSQALLSVIGFALLALRRRRS